MSTAATKTTRAPSMATTRITYGCALLAAALPGLLFTPVFGVVPLLAPIGAVVLAAVLVAELAQRVPALVPWRPLLIVLVGLLALVETALFATTSAGIPTGETFRVLVVGLTESWQSTLQSTWPAQPDPELLLFVPLAVLLAVVLAVELCDRARWPLLALLPGLVLLGLSQAYVALTGLGALLAGLAFAALAAGLLAVTRPRALGGSGRGRRTVITLALVVPTLVLAVTGGVAIGAVDVTGRDAYSLRQHVAAPIPPSRLSSPLDELPARMRHPDTEVFSYTSDSRIDYWRLAVLDEFNGATWDVQERYRRMGAELRRPPSVTADTVRRGATVTMHQTVDPWLPSQALPAEVRGVRPWIDESAGVLYLPDRTGPVTYDLSWWDPTIDGAALLGSAIDPKAPGGLGGVGAPPEGITELAKTATGDKRPSFQTAMDLERYLSANYKLATGEDIPTGNGWPQLAHFLLGEEKQGTSEQFAAAYVLLARITGIPARIAVGFRPGEPDENGTVVVHNADVVAWPEVAVAGVGWVPLDLGGAASGTGGGNSGGLAQATAEARRDLPPPEELSDPELPDDEEQQAVAGDEPGPTLPVLAAVVVVAALLALWVFGIPLSKAIRGWRRRRRPGARGVVAAWIEVRDRLRSHGVPFNAGMTVRDMATSAGRVVDGSVVAGMHDLAASVDKALWSGATPLQSTKSEAWSAVRAIRRGLAKRPLSARLRAALSPRSLFPPRS